MTALRNTNKKKIIAFSSTASDNDYPHAKGSSRGRNAVNLLPSYLTDARSVEKYCSEKSPNGALQLSVAENLMLEDLLVPAISNFCAGTNQTSAPELVSHFTNFYNDQIYYQPTHGRPGLRRNMAVYLRNVLGLDPSAKFKEDNMIMGAGCNAVLENLVFCLAEHGDAVLVPCPYYAAFEFDLCARAGLTIVPVDTQKMFFGEGYEDSTTTTVPEDAYYPTRECLDMAYDDAERKTGKKPAILLLSHPNNPLGICYPKEVVAECVAWAKERAVHLVSDEIYAGSVYTPGKFTSALSLAADERVAKAQGGGLGIGPYVHFVYSLSKDFASSGLRVGVSYTENEDIVLPLQKLNDLCQVSSQTQLLVERMLEISSKQDWPLAFLRENQKRIKSRSDALTNLLDELKIPYLTPDSGLFLWIDFQEFLPSTSQVAASADRERKLYLEMINEFGLLFTPGLSMRNMFPGFFRCVFTAASDAEFALALTRIAKFVSAKRKDI